MGISGYAQLAQFDTGDQALVKKATPIEVENLSHRTLPRFTECLRLPFILLEQREDFVYIHVLLYHSLNLNNFFPIFRFDLETQVGNL